MSRKKKKATEPGACRSCGKPILWAKSFKGKWVPIDVEPHPEGGLSLTLKGGEYGVLSMSKWKPGNPGRRFNAHFVSCPYAEQHRNAPRRGGEEDIPV